VGNRTFREPVSIAETVWNEVGRFGTEAAKDPDEERGSRRAVDVVVAMDEDVLAAIERLG
jgi:hypothetical protein